MTLPLPFIERLNTIVLADTDGWFLPRQRRSFRVNSIKASIDEAEGILKAQGIPFERVAWYPQAFIVPSSYADQILDSTLALEGKVYAQGLESMLPVIVLDPQPGETILDLCAAPGSKTTQLASHMKNEGLLWANEPVQKRFYRLKSVVELMGAKVKLSMSDGRYLRQEGVFDRILVDAPCSSEGRFTIDDPKSYGYWSLRKINEMAHKQKGLLLNAGRLLKPGGVMVYATCTFAPEENESVLDWFLRKTDGEFTLAPINLEGIERYPAMLEWNGRAYKSDVREAFRVLPANGLEGFFMAKLIRS